jgi:hypothetical protein
MHTFNSGFLWMILMRKTNHVIEGVSSLKKVHSAGSSSDKIHTRQNVVLTKEKLDEIRTK